MAKSTLCGAIDWKTFGERVGREIAKRKMTYRDLAEELGGITYANLNRVVHGKREVETVTYLWLCREFSIDPMWAYREPTVVI